jgi:hypothetical protein
VHVGDYVTKDIVCAREESIVDEAMEVMAEWLARARRAPREPN